MTDEEIRNAFKGAPMAAAVLVAIGALVQLSHADFHGLLLFGLGVAAIGLHAFLVEHVIRHYGWWTIPSMLFAVPCAFAGALAIIFSFLPYLPAPQ